MADYRTPIPALLAATLQSGVNTALALDEQSFERLGRLEGRVLKLVLEGTGLAFWFTADDHGIRVSLDHPSGEGDESEADTTVSGTPAALFSMAASELGQGWSAPNAKVNITGDAGLARDFERLFSSFDPDIEAAFSGLFGDVVGHQVAFGMKQGAGRARRAAQAAREVLGEVLRDGARGNRSGPLIGREEADAFGNEVDALRDAVDRLEARMRRLADAQKDQTPGS